MIASGELFTATKVLHYVAPFAIVGYFSVSSLWSIVALQNRNGTLRKRWRRAVITLMSLIAASFSLESILIIHQIFTTSSVFGTQDSNVYALSGILVWALLIGCKFGSDKHEWYPYYGAWALAFAFELTTFVLRVCSHKPETTEEGTQLALQFSRVISEFLLLGVSLVRKNATTTATDEETTPLLAASDRQEEDTSTRKEPQRATEESAVSDALEREEAKRDKKRKEKHDMLQARLHEHSNWFTYLREYMIFFPYIWPTNNPRLLWNMGGVALCLVAQRVLNVLGPRELGILTNSLNAGASSESFKALILFVLFNLLKSQAGLNGLQRVLWIRVERNARVCLDMASYNKIMGLSCDFHDDKQSGELFTQMRQGASLVNLLETCVYEIGPIATDLVVAFFYFYILFDSYLVLIAAATVIAYFWTSIVFTALQVDYRRKHVIRMRRKFQYQHDTVSSWRTVTYFNKIPHVERMYATSVNKSMDTWTTLTNLYNLGSAVKGFVLDLGRFAALLFAVYQVIYNGKDVGSFMTLFTYWGQFSSPLQTLASMQRQMLDELVDAEELRNLFQRQPTVPDGKKEMYLDKAEVEFRNVSFSYNHGNNVIDNLSFLVEAGKKVAIIGETGAGKSTLLKLLFRLYDTTQGSIRIDGQDIKESTLSSMREEIGVVPQEPSLFNDTIISNLRFGKLDITLEEAMDACRAAAIHDQIMKFPDGYNSVVGERGVKLSGGEKQRIAIARAILKQPKLILLDEATSSVDNETEEKIQEGLAKLCAGRTTIVIAHRLSTIMDSDLILVIKDGKILEQGTPKDLLRRKGKYYSLWSKQVGIIDAMNEIEEEESKKLIEDGSVSSTNPSKAPSNTDGAADELEKPTSEVSSGETATCEEHTADSGNDKTDDTTGGSTDSQSQHVTKNKSSASSKSSDGEAPPQDGASNGRSSYFPVRSRSNSLSHKTFRHEACNSKGRQLRPEAPEFVPSKEHMVKPNLMIPRTPEARAPRHAVDECGTLDKQCSDAAGASAARQEETASSTFPFYCQYTNKIHPVSVTQGSANIDQKKTQIIESTASDALGMAPVSCPEYRRPHTASRRGISRSESQEPGSADETSPSGKGHLRSPSITYGPAAAKAGGNSQGRRFSSASATTNKPNYGVQARRSQQSWGRQADE